MTRTTPNTTLMTAQRYHQGGRLAEAEAAYRQALQEFPGLGEALHGLAIVLAQTNRAAEALPWFRKAVKAMPQRPDFWNNLGEAERRAEQYPAAVAACREAVKLAGQVAEFQFTLGCALRDANQPEEAIAAFLKSLELKPEAPRTHYNLGNMRRRDGRLPVAVDHFRQALRMQPTWWEPRYNLAVTLLELGETAAAEAELAQVALPTDSEIDTESLRGDIALKQGNVDAARTYYAKSLKSRPNRPLSQLRLAMLGEVIPSSTSSIENYRAGVLDWISTHRESLGDWKLDELGGSGAEPPMMWAYHGRYDRPLKEAYAQLFLPKIPPFDWSARKPVSATPHIGVVVTSGHEGVFDRCLGGMFEQLAKRGKVRISWVSSTAGLNVLKYLRPTFSGGMIRLPDGVPQGAAELKEANLDGLYYWESGTDSLNYFLPFFRPACRQWVGWGWPVTVGHTRCQGFLSSQLLEPVDGDTHYTEGLIRLPGLVTWYTKPPVPSQIPERSRFGFGDHERVVLCTQNLRKLQPGFDQLIQQLLVSVPNARICFIADEQPMITERFTARMAQTAGHLMDRVRVLPRMAREEYLALSMTVDLILDPPGYGGGANTALDAAAAGIPVVTWRGPFHRGRWQSAVNELLGVPELSVDSGKAYLTQGVQLLTEPDLRQDCVQRIRERADELFENDHAVRDLEEFFLKAHDEPVCL